MIRNYYLFKVIATAGILWLVTVVLLFPRQNDLDSNIEAVYNEPEIEAQREVKVVDSTQSQISNTTHSKRDFFTKPENIFGESSLLGEGGQAVKLPKDLPPKIDEIVRIGWQLHQFNLYVSDLIPVDRRLKDHRPEFCNISAENYNKNLPATSVIIIFHNEAWSTLLRSVHSVINQSPDHLITEIILVDDFSDMHHLKKPLENYMSQFPKVKILRADEREGLIRARLRGAMVAKGPTLTFLDSHIEAAPGWLEPLLDRISKDATTVVCPVIDMILDSTLEFMYPKDPLKIMIGGFSWKLNFKWDPIPQRERERRSHPYEPIRSPTMAGGLFTIDKLYFEKLGMYDPDFDIWGGENLELSFKTWMCGGTLEIIPCSHVGHIFRKKSPYKWRPGVDVIQKNTKRLAEVWLDDYAQYYYMVTGHEKNNFGDISDRLKLRNNLGCKNFSWYMKNIYPEQFDPGDSLEQGSVKNQWNVPQACISLASWSGNLPVELRHCLPNDENQFMFLTSKGELRREELCMDFPDSGGYVLGYKCHGMKGTQNWSYDPKSNQIVHVRTSKCLSAEAQNFKLIMEDCSTDRIQQKWVFEHSSKYIRS